MPEQWPLNLLRHNDYAKLPTYNFLTMSQASLPTGPRKRSSALDILRGLTMLIVVIAHAMQTSLLLGEESLLWMRFIRPFQMPILFLISGWALAYSFPPRSHAVFLRKKAERLLVPYIVWMLIFYLITICFNGVVFSYSGLFHELMESDFWFLRALFLIYFAVWIGVFINEKWGRGKKWVPVASVILGMGIILLIRKIDLFRPTANGWFYQWFLTGYLAHIITIRYREKISAFMERRRTAIVSVCCLILVSLASLVYVWDLSQNLVAYLTIPSICLFIIGIVNYIPRLISRVLIHWGNISLAIYAIHWCLFLWSGRLLAKGCPECPFALRVLLLTTAWMLGCEALNWLFLKLCITRRLLLGEK